MALFAIFLLFAMLKVGTSFSGLTEGIANKGFEFMKDGLKAIPLPGIGSIGAANKALSSVKFGMSSSINKQATDQADTALKRVNELF